MKKIDLNEFSKKMKYCLNCFETAKENNQRIIAYLLYNKICLN
jgi:hypothetical protein